MVSPTVIQVHNNSDSDVKNLEQKFSLEIDL